MNGHKPWVCCRVLTDFSELQNMEAAWRKLFRDAAYATPFASWEWAQAWWRNFGASSSYRSPHLRLMVIAVYAQQACEEELIGLAPCYYPDSPENLGKPRVLRLLGDLGERGDSLTEERVALLKRGREAEAVAALLSYLSRISAPGKWDAFCLRFPFSSFDMSGAGRFWHPSHTGKLLQKQTITTEILELPLCWDVYRRGLSKSMRDNLAYYPRLLSRKGYDWTIRTVTEPAEMPEAIDHLLDLHKMRAESLRGIPHANHLASPTNRACLRRCLLDLAAEKMARILLLEVAGKPIGALSLLESAGIQTVYYTGFDPAFYDFSPLTILSAEAIQSAIRRGVVRVNFLAGTSRWNARWGAVSQPFMHQVQGLKMHPKSAWTVARHLITQDDTRPSAGEPSQIDSWRRFLRTGLET